MTTPGHVALIVGSLRGGGTERVCSTLANALLSRGYHIDVVVLDLVNAKFRDDLDSRINLVNLTTGRVIRSLPALRRYLRASRPQVVITFAHQLTVAIALLRATGLPRMALVARTGTILSKKKQHARGLWHRHVSPLLTKWWYAKADLVIAQSEGMARDLIAHYDIPARKVVTIPNPLSPRLTVLDDPAPVDRSKSSRILFVGRLDPPKDPMLLLRAFAICVASRPGLALDIVGIGSLQREVEQEVQRLGLQSSVSFHGFQPAVEKFYLRARLTVLSSLYEGLPNCLIESISLGTPVVSVDCDHGPRDIVRDGVNGFLVPRDERQLAEGILRAFDREWDVAKLTESVERFGAAKIIDRYESVISGFLPDRTQGNELNS